MVRERPRVNDEGDGRKYFTIIPNILFKLDLDPYQLCLYAYIKRVAGGEGACWKSRATIAKEIQMSEGMVTKSRRVLETIRPELGNKPLIVVHQEPNKDGGRPRGDAKTLPRSPRRAMFSGMTALILLISNKVIR